MSKIDFNIKGDLSTCEVHHLPCTINYNGNANVEKYFLTNLKTEKCGKEKEVKKISSTFRGRPLDGEVIELPDDYVGVIMKENRRPFNEDEDRNFVAASEFSKFTEWHLSSRYSSCNTTSEVMEKWIPISAAIHKQVKS